MSTVEDTAVASHTEDAASSIHEMNEAADPIYLDYNATSPVAPQVLAAMMPFFARQFGNASSTHLFGIEAHMALDTARQRLAALLGAQNDEIVFTGGGSESNNLAIKGVLVPHFGSPAHVITSAVDHPAVQNTCAYLVSRFGVRLTTIPVDSFGMVSVQDVLDAVADDTTLVSIMLANNEVGTIQPLSEIAHKVKEIWPSVLVHTDAAQAIGKIPVQVNELGVDMLTVAAHKFCGPKGVGALFVRRGTTLDPVIHGSSHERGCRAGTENIPGIVGLGMAAELARQTLSEECSRLANLRDRLERGVRAAIPTVITNGHPTERLPNTLNISFPGISGNALLAAVPGIAASTGSACHSASEEPSSVLIAMGAAPDIAAASIRLSIGRFTTEEQIDDAVSQLVLGAKMLGA